jgi:hypothetical protein
MSYKGISLICQMLDELLSETYTLKMRLIELGIVLSPPGCVHNNKLKQLQYDFQEIAVHCGYKKDAPLFEHAAFIYQFIIPMYFQINNLKDLKICSSNVHSYMSHYFSK